MTDRSLRADAAASLPVTGETPAALSLRDRIAAALREAAFLCDDSCDLADEAACDAAHPIQPTVLHFDVVTDIAGPVDAIADAVMGVVQAEIDRLTTDLDETEIEFEKRGQTITRLEGRAEKAETALLVAEARLKHLREGAEAVLRSRDTASHLLARDFLYLLDEPVLVPTDALNAQYPLGRCTSRKAHPAHLWRGWADSEPLRCPGTTTTEET